MEPSNADKRSSFMVQDLQMSATDWLVDCVIAAGAFGFGMVQLTLSANVFVPDAFTRMLLGIRTITPTPVEMASMAIMCLPLVFRRRLPWPAFAASLLLWLACDWIVAPGSFSMIAVLVSLFTLSYERQRTEAFAAGGIALFSTVMMQAFSPSSNLGTLLLFQNAVLIIAVTFAGYAFHARQEYLHAAEARAAEAERTRESEASRRVEEERVRIAREIHDITAHSLSAVSIQAAAAERLVDSDPEAAKAAISHVRQIAKGSLDDMRAMVGVLRSGTEGADTSPVEGTDRMEDLFNYLEEAGVRCTLSMDGYARGLVPSHIDVALFGIAREACTNIVRHASATKAAIALATPDGEATLAVSDDGCGLGCGNERTGAGAFAGHGIEGMRERAALLGGTFEIASFASSGTTVQVRIPLRGQGV